MTSLLLTLLLASPQLEAETIVTGLEIPWGLAFPDEKTILVTERPGRVRIVKDGKLQAKPLHVLRSVVHTGEAGLMDVELHPEFAKNRWVYFSYSTREGGYAIEVARFTLRDGALKDRKVILGKIPAARFHNGCRLGFGPDKKLYITTGDAVKRNLAQDLGFLGGKTLRLNDDGTIPKDNPFVGRKGARDEIWSYGHRNAQGITWHPESGLQFQTEHGPSQFDGPPGGDELNLVERGKNYGWPHSMHETVKPGTEAPLALFTPAAAPAGMAFYQGRLYFAGLRGACLWEIELEGRKVTRKTKRLAGQWGRMRAVETGPDGALYVATSNRDGRGRPRRGDDRILRVTAKGR
ncbi:MAG: PQQ-dependent sugar dehydrogenase [Planctomycetota bacterium]